MSKPTNSQALKEAYAQAKSSVVIYNTLQIGGSPSGGAIDPRGIDIVFVVDRSDSLYDYNLDVINTLKATVVDLYNKFTTGDYQYGTVRFGLVTIGYGTSPGVTPPVYDLPLTSDTNAIQAAFDGITYGGGGAGEGYPNVHDAAVMVAEESAWLPPTGDPSDNRRIIFTLLGDKDADESAYNNYTYEEAYAALGSHRVQSFSTLYEGGRYPIPLNLSSGMPSVVKWTSLTRGEWIPNTRDAYPATDDQFLLLAYHRLYTYHAPWDESGGKPIQPPPFDTINCAVSQTSGGFGAASYWVYLGTDVGEVTFYYNAYNVPDEFTVEYAGQTYTTGFRGSSSYNDRLADLGHPPVSGSGTGTLTFEKTAESDYALVTVNGPLQGTEWNFRMGCPDGAGAPSGPGGSPPAPDNNFYIIQATEQFNLPLALGGSLKTFEPVGFAMTLPGQNDQGVQDIGIAIDNVDGRVLEVIQGLAATGKPVPVYYRPYLETDLTQPQLSTPYVFTLSDIKVTDNQVSGRASFADIVNLKFLDTERYSSKRFPSLNNS
jgi:hypothetical protein